MLFRSRKDSCCMRFVRYQPLVERLASGCSLPTDQWLRPAQKASQWLRIRSPERPASGCTIQPEIAIKHLHYSLSSNSLAPQPFHKVLKSCSIKV